LPLKLRFGAELVESLLLGGQRVTPARLAESGFEFTASSLDAALRAIVGS
jgi:NAD dependent epimerase/dehydratase family enzyme